MALAFKSSFESFFSAAVLRAESMSVKHTKAVACPDCFWVRQPCLCEPATCPSRMRFLSKRYIYLKANHRFYFNMCMVGSWEEELQLVPARDSEQKLCEALSSPSLQTDLGEGELQEQPPWPWSTEPPLTRELVALPGALSALSPCFSPGSSFSWILMSLLSTQPLAATQQHFKVKLPFGTHY